MSAEERIRLRDGGSVVLHETGVLHPAGPASRFTPYAELIHVTLDAQALRIASERGSWRIPRAAFLDPEAAPALWRALRARRAALPDGAAAAARQDALDLRVAHPPQPRIGMALAALSVGLFVLGLFFPVLRIDGAYWGVFGLSEQPWRLVTAQLLHDGPLHLAFNALGLVVIVGLLERQLGLARCWLVLGAAGAGAMLGCAFAGYDEVVGASGLVMGGAGALLALEMRRPDLLPALWRLPRRLLIGALLADGVLLAFVPNVAHGAHAGGFMAGAAAALVLAPADAAAFAAGAGLRAAGALVLAGVLLALGTFAHGFVDPELAAFRRGARLLEEERVPPRLLNNYAWTLAISAHPTPERLDVALALARRAVRATRRSDPNLLDTLAEVYFQIGRSEDALATIDEAIELAPDEPYFREQRRRFEGTRAPDDRPEPPAELPEPPGLEPELEEPGIRV
jgi:membrane associated rhomboid family serine protease